MNPRIDDRSDRVCVIGAGYAGLGLAGALNEAGIDYDQLEATSRIGGNWSHGVYESTHLISSKKSTQYAGFPMPDDYPTFPSAAQMLAYLQSYVARFRLDTHLEVDTRVTDVRPVDANGAAGWYVEIANGEVRRYRAVAVANGHYWERNLPAYPGEFTGKQLHSKDYKRPADFGDGDRVLVVGGGNSASDIAVEASRAFGTSDISMRRGYWFIPKSIFGIPSSQWDRVWMPLAIQRIAFRQLLRLSYGDYRRYGLERPDHKLFTKDVTVNTSLMYALQHGRVRPLPEIERFDGNVVHFVNGASAEYDTIVWATGFHTRFPMLDETMFTWEDGQPLLVEHVLVPRFSNIYIWGLVAPRSGAGQIISQGSKFIVDAIGTQKRLDEPLSDLVSRWTPARSSILASSAEILSRIKLGRRALPYLAAQSTFHTVRS
ncbi:flavin-containing monooxygenase [Gordonia sp. (in: high G+C Gram-positive bacteria)]|uniref:flavin-containing monooxygenase n=1 Tax=Gordonia sp. (in: high G+C Gram-positive bacteria) TaxID=84139 RepID=UPI003F995594